MQADILNILPVVSEARVNVAKNFVEPAFETYTATLRKIAIYHLIDARINSRLSRVNKKKGKSF